MSDPLRLLDGDVPPHIRVLLEAARDAEPRSSLVETTLQSLRTADLGVAPSGPSPLISSVVIPVLVGVLALGALVGLTWTMVAPGLPVAPRPPPQAPLHAMPTDEARAEGGEATGDSRPEPSAQAGMDPSGNEKPSAAPRAPSDAAPPRNRPTSRLVAQPAASAPSMAQGAARKPSRSSTMAQRDLVLRARAALDGGAPQRALSILTGYEAAFDELRFVPEVLSLRMQAHQRTGSVEAAEQLARRIIATYPRSPQAGRARQLLRDGASRGTGN